MAALAVKEVSAARILMRSRAAEMVADSEAVAAFSEDDEELPEWDEIDDAIFAEMAKRYLEDPDRENRETVSLEDFAAELGIELL